MHRVDIRFSRHREGLVRVWEVAQVRLAADDHETVLIRHVGAGTDDNPRLECGPIRAPSAPR